MTNPRTANVAVASKVRAKTTNDPMRSGRLGRSAEARRVRDLFRSYVATLGNPLDPGTIALALAAAEQVVIAECARRDHLSGKVDLDAVVRAENMSARALRRLGLNKPTAKPRGPSLREIAAKYNNPSIAQNTAAAAEAAADERPAREASSQSGVR
jgi:hypothetical protein